MDSRVESITHETLTPIVRQLLDQPAAVPTTWEITPIHGGSGSMVGGTVLYRVSGKTEAPNTWSLVLKILYERPGETAESPYYWKREFELYRSRMLDSLPETGLRTPVIYECTAFPDACWIWMEDIQSEKQPWGLTDYRLIARRLGRFNGAYLTGHPIPDHAWLSDQWHCRIVPPLADVFDNLDDYLQHPLAQRALPFSEKDEILNIWQERERFCAALFSLPQTLCHLDVFRQNVFHSEKSTTLIDWALAGRAAVGEELVCLVALALYSPEFPPAKAETLDRAVFAGYMDGLRDVGWTGETRSARLGYTCAMTLRGLAGVKQDILLVIDEGKHAFLLRGRRFEEIKEIVGFWAAIRRFHLLKMAEEARGLLGISEWAKDSP
jgi:tRNA A-37 threonylcarbamoyl transferase component Bud32